MANNKECPKGMVWCPTSKKCIPEEEQRSKGQGKGMGRGKGKGPMGVPKKEDIELNIEKATELVDTFLVGDYSLYKRLGDANLSVDEILDEIENQIDHVPNQNLPELYSNVVDELTKDSTPVQEKLSLFKESLNTEEMKSLIKAVTERCKTKKVKEERILCMSEGVKEIYKEWVKSNLPINK
jgi:hypothetical protein